MYYTCISLFLILGASKRSTRKHADTLAKTEVGGQESAQDITMESSQHGRLYEPIAAGNESVKLDLPVAERMYDEIRSTQYEIPVRSPPESNGVDEVQITPAEHYELIDSAKPVVPKLVSRHWYINY